MLFPAHLDGVEGTLPIGKVAEMARAKGVNLLIDAAGQVYPLERFKRWAQAGDLVAFGAKYFGGLNSSGLLVGKKALVEAAVPQGFIGFETVTNRKGFGRPLKLDRQEIVGVAVALQEWMTMDHERRIARLEQRGATIVRALQGLTGVSAATESHEGSTQVIVRVKLEGAKKDVEGVRQALREGNPSIVIGTERDSVRITIHTIHDGDEEVVARRLRDVLA